MIFSYIFNKGDLNSDLINVLHVYNYDSIMILIVIPKTRVRKNRSPNPSKQELFLYD